MNVGIYRGAAAMDVGRRRLEVIASNLANVDAVGFKRQAASSQAFRLPGDSGEHQSIRTQLQVDFSQGEIQRTERPLDMALYGDGFFAVESPSGEIYTRDGRFVVGPDGVLQTTDGYQVAWKAKSGTIDPEGMPVVTDAEGTVRQGDRDVGTLRIVNFADRQRLEAMSSGYWSAPKGLQEATHTAVVHQGAVEGSNASGVEEIVALMTVQREFEAASNFLKVIEQSFRRLTRPA